ncbi:hypothetical protein SUGI_0716880 [Cryptomeria japonica]|nr:hypothetical protein SUGI_0716880 [Cryptomeria japonica]
MKSLVIAVVLSIMNAGVYGADPDPLTDFTTRISGPAICEVQDGSVWSKSTTSFRNAYSYLRRASSGQAFIDILHPGDVTIFPRGTLLFELNVGKEEANYISALNSQNPGVVTSSVSILRLPLRSVATAFNITQQAVKKLDSTIYASATGLKKTSKSGCVPGRDITVDF